MAGVALLAKQLGYEVMGVDGPVYPPMNEVLRDAGIRPFERYDPQHLLCAPSKIVIGNALSRGNPEVEYVLDEGLDYTSGPAFVASDLLRNRQVVAVAGTHGKTTTTSMIAWILEFAGQDPGFLIGGLPENFPVPARVGSGPVFVIEADEYDSAFFDKRAKFVHYRPQVLILNNLEYDHADIYPDLQAIERQFHHLIRTVPRSGKIFVRAEDKALERVLAQGVWSPVNKFSLQDSSAQIYGVPRRDGQFAVYIDGQECGLANCPLRGRHNMENALAAIAAARAVGVPLKTAIETLSRFRGVRRRLTLVKENAGIRLFDDFAHHPSAIKCTIEALREKSRRLLAIFEPRSNSMRMGTHVADLSSAFDGADELFLLSRADLKWDPESTFASMGRRVNLGSSVDQLYEKIVAVMRPGDDLLVMSNGGFDGMVTRLAQAISNLPNQ